MARPKKTTVFSAPTVTQLQPTSGYLLVKPAENKKQTASGIYLPDSKEDQPQYGTVLAVGSDQTTEHGVTISSPAKIGDSVVYKKWGGNEVKMDDVDYQILKFEDVLAIITK